MSVFSSPRLSSLPHPHPINLSSHFALHPNSIEGGFWAKLLQFSKLNLSLANSVHLNKSLFFTVVLALGEPRGA